MDLEVEPEEVSQEQDDEQQPSYDDYYRKLEKYLQVVVANLPPAVPPPPIHEHLAAQTLESSKLLLQPPPNLFKSTFEAAHRQSTGELWLQRHIAAFDAGNRRKRKEVLEEFLEYVKQSTLTGMEELFSKEAHLFLARLTSWFSITLPLLYELPLQLKVFLVFLEFREQSIVRAFFESGAVVALMNTLGTDFDAPDEVRCLAVLVLHRLAIGGRAHKEVLCSKGLVPALVECVLDGLMWETIKCSGDLLCELFRSNPVHQAAVAEALLALLGPRPPLAQRTALKALAQLTAEGYARPDWPTQLLPRLLLLMDGADLRVSADSYCLVCGVVRAFNCDTMLWDFARDQLRQWQDTDTWLELEVAASNADAVAAENGDEPARLKRQTDAQIARLRGKGDYTESCRGEAVHVLKLGLVMFLTKRSKDLCRELVNKGLTEALLMCLLDVSKPIRQAAAITEVHALQLLSPKAREIVASILVKREMRRALTAEQFSAAGRPEDFARARLRLRQLRRGVLGNVGTNSADEHDLHQRILEHRMADLLGPEATSAAFLTEGPQAEEAEDTEEVSRSDGYGVHRVPVGSATGVVSESAVARGYDLEHTAQDAIQEPAVLAALRNVLSEPLTLESAKQSALLQEVESLCLSARRAPQIQAQVSATAQRQRRLSVLKASHHASAQHRRALALRLAGPKARAFPDFADGASETSEATSLVCVAEAKDTNAMARAAQNVGWERASSKTRKAKAGLELSMADTSIGPDASQEFSGEISQELLSSHLDSMAVRASETTGHNNSMMSASSMIEDSHAPAAGETLAEIEEEEEARPKLLQTAGLAALVALPEGRGSFGKKLLCVAAPPYHNCVAFANEIRDERSADPPRSRQLLDRISFLRRGSSQDDGCAMTRCLRPGATRHWMPCLRCRCLPERSCAQATLTSAVACPPSR
ncbi:unnamed protein product [Effrenium voratum]|uniref:Uncharacterized protein n=1 Tax=Effrenium voratum TaxID=2562239 RepID=A0AA36MWE0_9DINO|nr:unnamed protein product [Effrenium voratum]